MLHSYTSPSVAYVPLISTPLCPSALYCTITCVVRVVVCRTNLEGSVNGAEPEEKSRRKKR